MNISRVTEGVHKLTTNIENILFEGIWEIPNGVSLNSYVVTGEKTALIDGFCGWDGVPESFFAMLDQMETSLDSIDYIIINHMEPDHSGWIEDIKALKKDIKIYCTTMAKNMLSSFYGQTENVIVVKDGDQLDLGNGRILQFSTTPNVHWPDAMVTFDTLSGTLFSCDIFGSYGSIIDQGYDDQLTEVELAFFENEAVRYYANIVGGFSKFAKKALTKCEPLPIKVIAPGHGLVWRKNPSRIISDYVRYANQHDQPVNGEITLLWGSMYGMTEKAVAIIKETLSEAGIKHHIHNVAEDSWGIILGSIWNSKGVILAMPTYENGMFPLMAAALEEIGKKKANNRMAFRTGSFGWAGGAEKELHEIAERVNLNWEFLPSVEFKGSPSNEHLSSIKESVQKLIECVK